LNLKSITIHIASYNTWANQKLIDWLKNAPDNLLIKEINSSYPTIKHTFLHIWNAERFWFSFLKKDKLEPFVDDFKLDVNTFFEGIINQSIILEIYINSLTEKQLGESYSINTPWLKGTQPCYVYIQHLINHSTYHRGQLITIGRILGLNNPPNTDFAFYLFNKS